MSKSKKHIHNKFNNIVKTVVAKDSTKKFMVSKISKNKYEYHSFTIVKNEDDRYACSINDDLIYDDIASFQLAMSLCYNYLFKKSGRIYKQLIQLNDEARKQQVDLMHYKYYLKHTDSADTEYVYARINESNRLYNKVKADIRNLSTSI